MLNGDAILYYAEHPVEFTEDVILAKPTPEQAAILRSVAENPMTTVRSGHGVGKARWRLGRSFGYMYSPISKDTMHGTDAAPAI